MKVNLEAVSINAPGCKTLTVLIPIFVLRVTRETLILIETSFASFNIYTTTV